ncbi:hypothetical protein DL766_008401 [Monosporascus sp. MC13-8B]|nr:hypothetical protein DL766_008401 [Monosporascus sp. MC13-8B]
MMATKQTIGTDSRAPESSRAKESQPQRIAGFYEFLGRGINKNVKPKNIINLDENGVQEGESRRDGILGSVLRKSTEIKNSKSTAWVSILEQRQEATVIRDVPHGKLGYVPPYARFRQYAQRVLTNSGSNERLGAKWVTRFLERNPEIRTLKGRAMDYRRLNGATPASAQALHSRLTIPEVRRILRSNWYNADEIGMMEGMGENAMVLGEALRKILLLKDAHKREWISIIVCISADGHWYFTVSPNGWTNNGIGLKWLREVFIPHTKPVDPTEWRLLIVDGHNSHTTEEFMWTCLLNRIYIVFLPSHSSQAFQALDVGVFSYFKRRFRTWFRERCFGRASEATDKEDFLWALERAWQDVFGTSKYIVAGFKASGTWPSRNIEVTDTFQKMDHFFWNLQAWLMCRFDALSALSTFVLTLLALYQGLSPGLAAFVLTTASLFVDATHSLCKVYGQLQMDFVSVERVVELLDIEEELSGDFAPPPAWPTSRDDITFDSVTLSRRQRQLQRVVNPVVLAVVPLAVLAAVRPGPGPGPPGPRRARAEQVLQLLLPLPLRHALLPLHVDARVATLRAHGPAR